ncbi:10241_t:CDS:2 [Gigaspora margarita]|uniref:10241_t:CDS:1 n=1 Tax=Gigaspora margarita TaxID=4874 RepID=A0ABN7UG49_GIGMA|nr:10241_t:CDS:2 [Gigaspora margarita]
MLGISMSPLLEYIASEQKEHRRLTQSTIPDYVTEVSIAPNTEVSFLKDNDTTEGKATCVNLVQDNMPSVVRNTDVTYSNSGNITKNQRAFLAQYLTEMDMLFMSQIFDAKESDMDATELNVSIIDKTKSDMLFMPQYHDVAGFDISFMPQYLNEPSPNSDSDHMPFIDQKKYGCIPFDHMFTSEKQRQMSSPEIHIDHISNVPLPISTAQPYALPSAVPQRYKFQITNYNG